MSGTVAGGRAAAQTNKQRYGANFYIVIGALGGKKSTGGGFAKNKALAREAGRLGGLKSKRYPKGDLGLCGNGHGWSKETTGYLDDGTRYCKVCASERSARFRITNAVNRMRGKK